MSCLARFVLACLFWPLAANATTFRVGGCEPGPGYASIAAALTAAAADPAAPHTIRICPGTYNVSTLNVDQPNHAGITLMSTTLNAPDVRIQSSVTPVTISRPNVSLIGLSVLSNPEHALLVKAGGDGVTVQRSIVASEFKAGIYAQNVRNIYLIDHSSDPGLANLRRNSGGAVYLDNAGNLSITGTANTLYSAGYAIQDNGGQPVNPIIVNTTFTAAGGPNLKHAGTVTMQNSTITAGNGFWGAIYAKGSGRHLIENCVIHGGDYSGGLSISGGGADIVDTDIDANRPAGQEALYLQNMTGDIAVRASARPRVAITAHGDYRSHAIRLTASSAIALTLDRADLDAWRIGVWQQNGSPVTLRLSDSNVTARSHGIYVENGGGAHVLENLSVSAGGTGIFLQNGQSATLTDVDSAAVANAVYVIGIGQVTVDARNKSRVTLQAAGGGSASRGLEVGNTSVLSVSRADIHSDDIGVYQWGSNATVEVRDSSIESRKSHGIYVDKGAGVNRITNDTVTAAGYGVFVQGGSGSEIAGNTVRNAGNHGITVAGDAGATVHHNRVEASGTRSGNYGVYLAASGQRAWDNCLLNTRNASAVGTAEFYSTPFRRGNFWGSWPAGAGFSDSCADSNGDGICDSPYAYAGTKQDLYPLAVLPNCGATAGGAVPAGFNAFDSSTPANSVNGVIHTKVAGQTFAFDVVALKAGPAVETSFTGDVKLELVDASAGSCASYPSIQNLGTLTFAAGDQGRKTKSGVNEANAWPNVRVRISYPATGTPSVVACSTDNFAIRPARFDAVAVTDQDSSSAGTARALTNTAATGGVVHRAGRPFRIAATAVNALGAPTTNYTGNPDASVVSCDLPTTACTAGALTSGTWSPFAAGSGATTTATYAEAGVLTMKLVDLAFAAVDSADGSTDAERAIESAPVQAGRFVPDHFDLLPAGDAPRFKTFNDTTCAQRAFTYVGQPFGYVTLPQAQVTAKNYSGGKTENYAASLWHLVAANVSQTYTATTGLLDTGAIGTPALVANGAGTGTLTANAADVIAFTRTTPVAPFAAQVTLEMRVRDTSENAVVGNGIIDTVVPVRFTDIAFDSGNEIRFGRLRLVNAHGSELLDLPVPIETQYWTGSAFARNGADSCTRIDAANLRMGNWQRNLAACETSAALGGRFNAGRGNLRLSRPGAGNSGSVDLAVELGATASGSVCVGGVANATTAANQPWLAGAWSAGAWDQNPAARASFGLYRGNPALIYSREAY